MVRNWNDLVVGRRGMIFGAGATVIGVAIGALPGGAVADTEGLGVGGAPRTGVRGGLEGAVATAWPRVWGGALRDVVLIVMDDVSACVIDVASSVPVTLEDLERRGVPILRPGQYAPARWDGRLAVAIHAEGWDSGPMFDVATHEAFHFHVQSNRPNPWPIADQPYEDQFDWYPLDPEPRVVRAMLFNTLVNALRDHGRASLAAASWWNLQWAQRYPGERARALKFDTIEGSAEHVGKSAMAMLEAADPDSAIDRASYFLRVYPPVTAQLDNEHYRIGGIAGAVLDLHGSEWQTAVPAGATLPDLLLANVPPSTGEIAPASLRTAIETATRERNLQIAGIVGTPLAWFEDRQLPLLQIPLPGGDDGQPIEVPYATVAGRLRTAGVPLAFTAISQGRFTTSTGRIEAKETAVFHRDNVSVLPLPRDSFTLNGDRMTITGGHLRGEMLVERSTDPAGRDIFDARA